MAASPASLQEALLQLRARAAAAAGSLHLQRAAALEALSKRSSPRLQPSGPRPKGVGVEDEIQEILSAEPLPSSCGGGVVLRITLLAAGFVVGPSGCSIREVCATTGADVRSFTTDWQGRRVREMHVQGEPAAVVRALDILSSAVTHYSQLCGGPYCGQAVDREQVIQGVTFHYSPPPRAAVPYAASLRAPHERPSSPPSARKLQSGASPGIGAASTPRGANKENGAWPAGAPPQAPPAAYRGAGAQVLSPNRASPLLATPAAPRGGLLAVLHPPAPTYSGAYLGGGGMAAMEVDEADGFATPAYRTAPGGVPSPYSAFAAAAAAATPAAAPTAPPAAARSSFSLFGSSSGGFDQLVPQQAPFEAPASSFASAFEPFGAAAATPFPSAGPLARAASGAEDALQLQAAAAFAPSTGWLPQFAPIGSVLPYPGQVLPF